MKTRTLLSIILFAAAISSQAQTYQFNWAASIGGAGFDITTAAATDADGNSYITGIYHGTVDFDPSSGVANLTAQGSNDAFILKLNNSGNLVWAKSVGGLSDDKTSCIALGSDRIFVGGSFAGTADFNPGSGVANLTGAGFTDGYVLALDTAGSFISVARIGGSGIDVITGVAVNALGTCVITGYFEGTIGFTPSAPGLAMTSAGSYDAFIVGFDNTLAPLWSKRIGGPTADNGISIATDASNGIVYGGYFSGTGDYDPGQAVFNLTSTGSIDAVIARLDSNGDFDWAVHVGGVNDDVLGDIDVHDDGTVAVTGYFIDAADFDPGTSQANLTAVGQRDCFIMVLDANGNLDWVKQVGSLMVDEGKNIELSSSKEILVAGFYGDAIDLDPGTQVHNVSSAGGDDGFAIHLNASGDLLESATYGSASEEVASVATFMSDGGVLVAGTFSGQMDADPFSGSQQLTPNGQSDVFIVRLGVSFTGIPESDQEFQLSVYPNPTTDRITITSQNEAAHTKLLVYNHVGELMHQTESIFENEIILDVAAWPAGSYIVVFEQDKEMSASRFIKAY